MKNIRLSALHYEMLLALGKRNRLKPEQLIEKLIEEKYNAK